MVETGISVFISHALGSEKHLAWVTQVANILQAMREFDVVFDQYDLHAGLDLTHFMDRGVRCDRIVVVVTTEYVRKANERIGGVGYESSVISAALLDNQSTDKFIPLLREGDERPSFLKSKVFIDFRDDSNFSARMNDLVAALRRQAPVARPSKIEDDPSIPKLKLMDSGDLRGAPIVIASLPIPTNVTEYFGPVEIENVSEWDAFNVDIGDISNGSQLARFSRIARLKPHEKVDAAPTIKDPGLTRAGYPDLYKFAWVGQIGHIWHRAIDPSSVLPKDEIAKALHRNFVTPVRISYIDAMSRSWATYSELIFGRDRTGHHRLAIEFRRLEPTSPRATLELRIR